MGEWDATTYEAKDNLLRVLRGEAEALFAMASAADAWERPTACPLWQVRDIVGHLIDVTESYFTAFDASVSGAPLPAPLGLPVMAERLDEGAQAYRSLSQADALERLEADFAKMTEIASALDPEEWGGRIVTHKYMGPLPAFFYPIAQLMDYGVHGWDIRQGIGRAHSLAADTADLLVPFMFILWQATTRVPPGSAPATVGVRVSGRNAGEYRFTVSAEGLSYELGEVASLPAVLEFDPGSLVLTTFGRINAGAFCGDRIAAEAFLNAFFRI
jgi:uncharacterized protein (TIGR03083 family)